MLIARSSPKILVALVALLLYEYSYLLDPAGIDHAAARLPSGLAKPCLQFGYAIPPDWLLQVHGLAWLAKKTWSI